MSRSQKKPRAEGCKKSATKGHSLGPLWSCERCGKKACARCAKYYWRRTANSGTVRFVGGETVLDGARVALCTKCCR